MQCCAVFCRTLWVQTSRAPCSAHYDFSVRLRTRAMPVMLSNLIASIVSFRSWSLSIRNVHSRIHGKGYLLISPVPPSP
eukprot:6225036-Pyramimonas_sp.AAC.1